MALNARLYGGLRPWSLIFPWMGWTLTLLAGFLNFQLGLGLALMAAAGQSRVARLKPWRAAATHAAIGGALMIVHPFATAFYAAVLAGLGLGAAPIKLALTRRFADRFATAAPPVAAALLPLVGLHLAEHLFAFGPPPRPSGAWVFNTGLAIPPSLLSPLLSYNARIDLIFVFAALSLPAVAERLGKLTAHGGLVFAAAGLAIAGLAMPSVTPQAGWFDRRLPPMALLTLLAAVDLRWGDSRRREVLLAATCMALVTLRTAWIGYNWSASQNMVRSLARALAPLPVGARLLPVAIEPTPAEIRSAPPGRFIYGATPTYWHLDALAVPWRGAFVPTLFAAPGKQPLRVRPPFDRVAYDDGGQPPDLFALDGREPPRPYQPYLAAWRRQFDYVLVMNADDPFRRQALTPPAGLSLVTDQGFARLYRISPARQATP
jgi:hypothetical protein